MFNLFFLMLADVFMFIITSEYIDFKLTTVSMSLCNLELEV